LEDGRLKPSFDSVHLPRESPLINRHHNNWRMQSLKAMEQHREEDLFFSAPIVATLKVKEKIKAQTLKLIEKVFLILLKQLNILRRNFLMIIYFLSLELIIYTNFINEKTLMISYQK